MTTNHESIDVAQYNEGFIVIQIRRHGVVVWTRKAPKADIARLRNMVLESNFPLPVQKDITGQLDDIEDRIIDEMMKRPRKLTIGDWLFWIFFAMVISGMLIAALELWFKKE